jgi:hypothetical protein
MRRNAGTTFEGGILNDILLGPQLEVHGSLISGIVNAIKGEFDVETERYANVDTINPSNNTLTLVGQRNSSQVGLTLALA